MLLIKKVNNGEKIDFSVNNQMLIDLNVDKEALTALYVTIKTHKIT